MRGTKVVAVCIFNELQTAGLFLALDGTSTLTDPFISGRKHRKLVYIAVFIRNESLFIVSAACNYKCIPISAHAVVATQHMRAMKYGPSNMGKCLSCRSMGILWVHILSI